MRIASFGFGAAALAAVAFLGFAGANTASAAPVVKVEICHVNGASDGIPTFNPTTDLRIFYPGVVTDVPEAAVDGHVGHGDSATPGGADGEYRTDQVGLNNLAISAEVNGLTMWKHADCFVTRLPDLG